MKDYKRLTKQLDENFYVEDCLNCPKNWCCGQDDNDFMCREALQQRLGELEDKIEQQELVSLNSVAKLLYKWFDLPCHHSHTNFDFAEYMYKKHGDWCEDNCGKLTADNSHCWEMFLKSKLAELRGGK